MTQSLSNDSFTAAHEIPVSAYLQPTAPPVLDDTHLAAVFDLLAGGVDEVLVVSNAFTVCVWQRATTIGVWQLSGSGEFGDYCLKAVRPLLRRRLIWAQVEGYPLAHDPAQVEASPRKTSQIRTWLKISAGLTIGREGDVTPAIKDQLGYLAGWRCQFSGCGRDLRAHGTTGGLGRYSYFAHIVAASPDGPRGHVEESRRLASDISNFLLLCDECHREIDKVRPADYPVELLRKMREENIAEVARLLDTLRYQEAYAVGIVGNLAGQPAQFSITDAHEALWSARLRSTQGKPARYFDPGGQHHDVHSAGYWLSLFPQLKQDISELQTILNGTRTGSARPRLAIFPQHTTSVLTLAGRIFGDTAGIHVFQPHRNQPSGVSRWVWPKLNSAPSPEKYKAEVLRERTPADQEAVLVIGLTWDVATSRMPEPCAARGDLALPTVRITGTTFDSHCIAHQEDLAVFGKAVDRAMQILQDEWGIKKIHLFICAPASAVFTVGQKMQARHHADYIVYESVPGEHTSLYSPTIELTSRSVRELVSGQGHSHSL